MPQLQSSFVYPDSVEVSKSNPNKRYFRVFLMNNSVTRPVTIDGLRWQIENVGVLDRDIDTFIGRPVIPFDKTKEGKHVDPADKGIRQPRYKSKLDFIKDANAFYDDYGKAKIIDIYKPNKDVMIAAKTNPNTILNYDAFCETEDPELIKLLDANEKTNTKTYVSPGIVAIDSYYTDDNIKVVKQFVGTHTHIVDEPAFTEPIAYIHKRTCNIDGKTCYYDLLTASEEKTLNTNLHEQQNMSSNVQTSADEQVSLGQVVDDLNKAGQVSDQELNNIDIHTEAKDASGKVIEKLNTNTEASKKNTNKNKNNKKASEENGEGNGNGVEKETEVEKVEKYEKVEKEETEAPITASKLQEILAKHTENVLAVVKQEQQKELETTQKLQIVASFIPATNEDLKADYDFYNNLPLNKDQLRKVLEDSKFNPNNSKRRVSTNTDLAVGSTAKSVETAKYNDNKGSRSSGTVEDDIHFLPDGDSIPSRYR